MFIAIGIGVGISLFLIFLAFCIVGGSKRNPIDVKDSDDAQMEFVSKMNKKESKVIDSFGKDR